MHAKFLDTLDWGIRLFSDSYRHWYMGKFQTKEGEQSLFGGTFFEMAPHRILHVGD